LKANLLSRYLVEKYFGNGLRFMRDELK